MSRSLTLIWDPRALADLQPANMGRAIKRALRKAGATALRDMRSEASKRVRTRKRLKPAIIREAIHLRRLTINGLAMELAVDVSGKRVPLIAFPHRQTKKGVSVEVNRGKRSLVKHAFIQRMTSGHLGIYVRQGPARLPIRELFGSRPVDALLHAGEAEAVAARGSVSLAATFARLLPLEIGKGK